MIQSTAPDRAHRFSPLTGHLGRKARKAVAVTDVISSDVFKSLEQEAARLNEASQRINDALRAVEQRLTALNLGIEVWHPSPILREEAVGNIAPYETTSQVVHVLGFARVGSKWGLAVKQMRIVRGFYQGDMNAQYENPFLHEDAELVLQLSREIRIAALGAIPDLLQTVKEQVTTTRQYVERAANQAEAF